MPITISQIANNTAKVSFNYGEDEINLEYYPARITERTLAQMQEIYSMHDETEDIMHGFHMLNEILAGKPAVAKVGAITPKALEARPELAELTEETLPLLKSWDVLEDDGVTMFPIKAGKLSLLPIAFRLAVLKTIMGDIRPNDMALTTS